MSPRVGRSELPFMEEWRREAEEREARGRLDRLQTQVDELTYRLDQQTKGGRPGPNWEAYAGLIRVMLGHGIDGSVVRIALNNLILLTEVIAPPGAATPGSVTRHTVDKRVREMIKGVLLPK